MWSSAKYIFSLCSLILAVTHLFAQQPTVPGFNNGFGTPPDMTFYINNGMGSGSSLTHSSFREEKTYTSRDNYSTREVKQLLHEKTPVTTSRYSYLPYFHKAGSYYRTFDALRSMFSKEPFSLSRTVFLIENAYFDERLKYEDFTRKLSQEIDWVKYILKKEKLDTGSSFNKNYAILKLFSEKVTKYDKSGNIVGEHEPVKYDFDDYRGDSDWSKMFVSKLMHTGKGQCHSMPLLFLLIAEEMHAETYMALAPEHSYVRFQDVQGTWYNYETTNGTAVTDDWLMQSGYVNAEAIRSETYMDTLGTAELIAGSLADLAQGYAMKFGYDLFVLDVLEEALRYDPDNLQALMLKSDIITMLALQEYKKAGEPPMENLHDYPAAYTLHNQMLELYQHVDALGYQPMPEELYQQWLISLEEEKRKREKEELDNKLFIHVQKKH